MNFYSFLLVISNLFNTALCIQISGIKDKKLNKPFYTLYGDINIFKHVNNIDKPLTETFPFLNYIDDICVELYLEDYDINSPDMDCLNLGECKTIKSFKLKGNGIKEIPEYILSFNHIYDISFFENKLTASCFDKITELPTLRSLNLGYNLIEEIPQSILKLKNLNNLSLDLGFFSDIPVFISKIQLRTLNISLLKLDINKSEEINNREGVILKIINSFLKIRTLEYLKASYNGIENLDFYSENCGIKRLDLNHNNLSTLDNTILKFKNLEYLDLRGNAFKTVPSILVKLENLKTLDLQENLIPSYKDVCFYSLETLHNSFDFDYIDNTVPIKYVSSALKHLHVHLGPYSPKVLSEIFHMVDLKSLFIYQQLTPIKLTDEIAMLENLETLHIGSILVENIIDSIFGLKNLKTLYLNLNPRETKGFPQNIFLNLKRIENLEYLSLKDSNNKSKLDDNIFDLINLINLELSGFFIENIEGFNKLINLKCLVIKNTSFNESRVNVYMCLKRSYRKVQYNLCTYHE